MTLSIARVRLSWPPGGGRGGAPSGTGRRQITGGTPTKRTTMENYLSTVIEWGALSGRRAPSGEKANYRGTIKLEEYQGRRP